MREHYNPIVQAITEMAKPVVAGVNGVAAGAGFGFALAADYRVVAETASFNTSFAGVALTADSGVSWTLPRLIGPSRAADLLFFPRSISAQDALELGLVNRVVPAAELAEQAAAVARTLADGPTVAYAALKESMAYGAGHTLAEALEKEDELQTRAGASQDHVIAVEAFLCEGESRLPGEVAGHPTELRGHHRGPRSPRGGRRRGRRPASARRRWSGRRSGSSASSAPWRARWTPG
ncbi:Carnitinyl-CoA dehydratase [Streptomyces microflavus]